MKIVKLDLYTHFVKRFDRRPLIRKLRGNVEVNLTDGSVYARWIFYGLFRIILACDAAHDFTASRGDFSAQEKNLFAEAMSDAVTKDLKKVDEGLTRVCEQIIDPMDRSKYRISGDHTYFSSDTIAKSTVDKILNFLGLRLTNVASLTAGDCSGDYSIRRMISLINLSRPNLDNNFELRIDATQNSLDMLPIYNDILVDSRMKRNGCKVPYEVVLKEDISSVYDAANDDKMQKALKDHELVSSNIQDTRFEITCGGLSVVNCELKIQSPSIVLRVENYFGHDIQVAVSNDRVNGVLNNSVKGIVNYVHTAIAFKINKLLSKGVNPDVSPEIRKRVIFRLSIAKTMGDFLQIASFISSNNENKMFVSADILSTEICSIFSKNSFIEKIKTKEYIIDGLGIYMTEEQRAFHSGVEPLLKLSGNKRQPVGRYGLPPTISIPDISASDALVKMRRQSFGSSKLSSMSTRELSSKLKSVGIVTQSKTRAQLERKAAEFKKLQTQAKKKGIRITYTQKGKRSYKTEAQLRKELGPSKFG